MAAGLVAGEKRLADLCFLGREIVEGYKAAPPLHFGSQIVSGPAGIKFVRAVFCDTTKGGGEFRLPQYFSGLIERTILQENFFRGGGGPPGCTLLLPPGGG